MITVAALYKFAPLENRSEVKMRLAGLGCSLGVKGTLLLAHEGINGTIAGSRSSIDAMLGALRAIDGFADLDWKESTASVMPFRKLKVRLKREIVTMKVTGLDPRHLVGTYVDPRDWNDLIAREDVVVIDTRNRYETEQGSFQGAIDPGIDTFSEFPAWWEKHAPEFAGKQVAMFCTGGIRCEKSTSYVKSLGVDNVFHLKGGILKYLEEVPTTASLWRGNCFVFDERGGLVHGLLEASAADK